MPLPLIIWLWWSSVLGLPEWRARDTQDNQKSV